MIKGDIILDHILRTFRIPAHVADRTAPLVLDDAAALGAGAALLHDLFGITIVTVGKHVVLDGLGYRIGAGGDAVVAETGRAVAGDAQQLLDDLAGLYAAAPGQRYHAADGLGLGSGATASLAHGGEQLEQTIIVLVDRDVQRSAAGLHLVGLTLERLGTLALDGLFVLFHRCGCHGGMLFLLGAGGEHLLVAGTVAVDGDPLAARFVGHHVDVFHVFDGGGVGKVDRLADGVVRMLLEGRLHLDVIFGADVVGRDKDVAHIGRHLGEVCDSAVLGDLLHQLYRVEAALLGDLLEVRVDLHHDVLVHDGANVGYGEERFDTRG